MEQVRFFFLLLTLACLLFLVIGFKTEGKFCGYTERQP
jgi:hypothetical protein